MLLLPPGLGWVSAAAALMLFIVIGLKARNLSDAVIFDVRPVFDYPTAKANRDKLARPGNKQLYRCIVAIDLALIVCFGTALYCWITLSAQAAGVTPQPWMALLVGAGAAFDLFEDMVGLYAMKSTRVFDRRTATRLAAFTTFKFIGYGASILTSLAFTLRLVSGAAA